MKATTKDLLKDSLVTIKNVQNKIKEKVGLTPLKEKLIHLYFKSPTKVQYALAKFGIKHVYHNKKEQLEDLIRH